MSRTLFNYIFWDLIRIFGLTSGALAGIMSFGGLLRPLTQNGLDAGQVGKILTYFMPAMSTYSLPVAALFATTMVYGRLSADNELTAMRAAGISYLKIATPAMVLGLVVSLASLIFLCFVVPIFTLKVEKVIYSNLAKIVATSIERSHEISGGIGHDAVHAQGAILQPPDPAHPNTQCVVLIGPTIIQYDRTGGEGGRFNPPREFMLAQKATLYIEQKNNEAGDVDVRIIPEGGIRFPRRPAGGNRAGLAFTAYGPVTMPSPIKENSKFMVLSTLHEYYQDPGKARGVKEIVDRLIAHKQTRDLFQQYADSLNTPPATIVIRASDSEEYVVRTGDADVTPPTPYSDTLTITAHGRTNLPHIERRIDGRVELAADANQIIFKGTPDAATGRIDIDTAMDTAIVSTPGDRSPRTGYHLPFNAPLPPDLAAMKDLTPTDLLADKTITSYDHFSLQRELMKTSNQILAEMNNRASFAVACLILVLIGCALGIMFRSGNFLTAFAVSVAPALLSIVLIVTGQHTCENIPYIISAGFHNPLRVGIALIWSGNVLVAVIATVLMVKLQRR